MKLLYVSDHRFHEIDGSYYSETQFPAAYWQRYLTGFDSIRVVGRLHDTLPRSVEGLILSSRAETCFALVPNHLTPSRFLKNRRQVIDGLERAMEGVDAVILKSPGSLGQYVSRMAAQRNIPYAIEMVGCPFDAIYNHGSLVHKVTAWLAYWSTRRQVRAASAITYVTKAFLQGRYPSDARVNVAASDVEISAIDEAVLEARLARIGTEPLKTVRLGLIGGLMTKAKGHAQALEVVARLKEMGVDAHLDCVGAGRAEPYEDLACELGIGDRVTFKGTLPGFPAISEWLDGIDIYIQPSLQEGLPRALVETISRACPSVANRTGGMPELLPDRYIVPANGATEMAKIIARAAADPEELSEMARTNFAKSREYLPEKLSPIRMAFITELAACARETACQKRAV